MIFATFAFAFSRMIVTNHHTERGALKDTCLPFEGFLEALLRLSIMKAARQLRVEGGMHIHVRKFQTINLVGAMSLGAKPAGVKRTNDGLAKPPPASVSKPRPSILDKRKQLPSIDSIQMPDGLSPAMRAAYVFSARTSGGGYDPLAGSGVRSEEDLDRHFERLDQKRQEEIALNPFAI